MKNKRTIIIICCIIALLITGILALSLLSDAPDEPAKTQNTTRIKAFATEKEFSSISFNADKSFTLVQKDKIWSVLGKEYTDLDQNAVVSAISTFKELYATRALSPEGELSDYGIDIENPTAEINFADSTSKSFYLGSLLPDESGYYCFLEGQDSVYVISKLSAKNIGASLTDFRNLTVTEFESDSVTSFSLTGENGLISMKYSESNITEDVYGVISDWKMTHPHSYDADNEAVEELILTKMLNIAAEDVLEDLKENSKKYRLPYSFEFTSGGQTYSFGAGFNENFGYILSYQKGITYKVALESLSFLKVSFFDVAEKFLSIIPLDNLESATVYSNGKTAVINTQGTGDNQKYFIDGKEYSLNEFRPYYQALISAEADGEVPLGYSKKGEMLASLKFVLKDSKTEYFEFYDYDELNCAVYENGKCLFFMRRTLLDYILTVLK